MPVLLPQQGHCCGWTGPGSSYDCRMHFSKNHQGTLRNKISYSQVLEGTQHAQGSHSEVMDKGLSLSMLGVPRVSRVYSLLANLSIRGQEGKTGVTQVVSYWSYPGLSEKGLLKGRGGLVP